MTTDTNLQFIRKKLDQIGMAIMYTMNNDVVKLPNDIVQYLKTDDNGQLWLTAHKPRYWVKNYEQCFPVRLFFYRKGVDFYIEMNGIAIVEGKEDVSPAGINVTPGSILLRITPSIVEYTETKKKELSAKHNGLYSYISNWLLNKMQIGNSTRQVFSRLS